MIQRLKLISTISLLVECLNIYGIGTRRNKELLHTILREAGVSLVLQRKVESEKTG